MSLSARRENRKQMTRTNKGRSPSVTPRITASSRIVEQPRRRRRVTLTEDIVPKFSNRIPLPASRYRRSADVCTLRTMLMGFWLHRHLHRHLIAQVTAAAGTAPQAAVSAPHGLAVGRRNSGSASTVWRRRECPPIKAAAGTSTIDGSVSFPQRGCVDRDDRGRISPAPYSGRHDAAADDCGRKRAAAAGSNFRLRLAPSSASHRSDQGQLGERRRDQRPCFLLLRAQRGCVPRALCWFRRDRPRFGQPRFGHCARTFRVKRGASLRSWRPAWRSGARDLSAAQHTDARTSAKRRRAPSWRSCWCVRPAACRLAGFETAAARRAASIRRKPFHTAVAAPEVKTGRMRSS